MTRKKSILLVLVVFCLSLLLYFSPNSSATEREELKKLNAKEALALANQWRWAGRDVTSYVNAKEIVFKFPDGEAIKIPLPKDEMIVAVAPYINITHE